MAAADDWRDRKYSEVFDDTCEYLEQRRQAAPAFTREQARRTLETLYVRQGQNWDGRGEVDRLTLAATVAAYEAVLAEWPAEP